MRGVLSAAVWAVVVAWSAVASAAGNVLRNPGLEMLDGGENSAAGWTAAKSPFSYVSGGGRNGTRALFFDVRRDSPYAFPCQAVELERGKRYVASAWVRTKDVAGAAEGALIGIEWKDVDGKHISGVYALGVRGTTDDWTRIQVVGEVPQRAAKSFLVVFVRRGATGRAWFDDLVVEPYEQPLIGHLRSSVYRDTASSGPVVFRSSAVPFAERMEKEGLRGVFEIPSAVHGGAARDIPAALSNGVLQTTVDVASLPTGRCDVVLRVVDGSGRERTRRETTFTRTAKEPDWKVRVDRSGRLIVDGKPFFPIGVFVSSADAKTIADVKKGPFNYVMPYTMPTKAQMDACHKAGLKVVYSLKDAFAGMRYCPVSIKSPASEDAWIKIKTSSFKDHPALLAWYINDEAGPEMAERLVARRRLLSEIDPDHPTYACENQIEHLRDFAGTFDIVGTDPYPIAHPHNLKKPISMVGDWTRRTVEAFNGDVPVWEVLQIFDWGAYLTNSVSVTRAPTEREIRNMAWQSIAAGANGLLPFAYHSLHRMSWRDSPDDQWAKVCRAYGEIAKYSSVFLSAERPPKVDGVPSEVFARTWRHHGKTWLLVVNARREPVTARLRVEGCGTVNISLDALGVTMRRIAAASDAESQRPLFAADDFTVLNIAPFSPGTEELLAKEMVEYKDRTGNDVVLYSLTIHPQGFPAMKTAEFLLDSYRALRRALDGSGLRLGVLMQSTLGHWPRVDKNEESWMRSITLEGKEKRFCPIDPNCRKYVHDVVKMIAEEKPCFIMIDDDVHASGTFGVECFCERHTAMFNAANGTSHTPASLRKAVKECKPGDPVCVAFQEMQRRFVNDLVDVVRTAVDEVDPSIPAGACMPARERRFAGETARRVAARGQAPVLRIDNAVYLHRTLTSFADKLAYTMSLCDWYRDIPYLLDESDTWPHNRWSMSASLLEMKLEAAAFCGLHGSKLWYCNAHKGSFPVSRAYTDALASRRGVCSEIASAVHDSELSGIVVPVVGGRVSWHPDMWGESFAGDGNWGSGMAGGYGVPFCCRSSFTADAIYTLGGADAVSKLKGEELFAIFRHRVLVDGAAAIELTKRGLQHLAGVSAVQTKPKYNLERDIAHGVTYAFSRDDKTPCLTPVVPGAEIVTHLCYSEFNGDPDADIVSPGMVCATNALGGRVLTTAFFAGGFQRQPSLTDMRKEWFFKALSKLGWNGWAVLNDQDVALLERKRMDGTTLLAVFNTSFDEIDTLKLRTKCIPKTVDVLVSGGEWRRQDFSQMLEGIELPVRLSCSHACVMRISAK